MEPIAIVGIGCRLPGGANSPDAFWRNLCGGVNAVREIPSNRWNIDKFYDPEPGKPGKSISKWGGFIDCLDQFDPDFFGISPREAASMDPQQRLLLEAAWEAIEDGGVVMEPQYGYLAGVFVGISTHDYTGQQATRSDIPEYDIYSTTGVTFSIAANRISYGLNLTGPSMAVDTACSSSLVAIHLACQSLAKRECKLALAGGVNALISPSPYLSFSRMGMIAPDNACKVFDARANGFVRGEGVGVVALKHLADAQADGNPIYAVILSTAINQDGRTTGITVPNADSQASLIRLACANAGVEPHTVQYVEAHGTGTTVGDPTEAAALGRVFGDGRDPDQPCMVGSVKTNIGHLEAGAGIAGLIKLALVLKHGRIPPNLHFEQPNPKIDFKNLKIRVPTTLEPAQCNGNKFTACINSFGFGGTNALAVLQAPPESKLSTRTPPTRMPRAVPLLLSARTGEALTGLARKYVDYFTDESRVEDVESIARSAALSRLHHHHRLCIVGTSKNELADHLSAFINDESRPGMTADEVSASPPSGPVFVFSGQGPQWWNMGAQLLQQEPVFKNKIQECDRMIRDLGEWSLLEELARGEDDSRLHDTAIAQPAIFALQVALSGLLESWGIMPSAVTGHSVGEVAAAHVAGVLDLADATRVIFHRGRCMSLINTQNGRMLAAGIPRAEAEELVRRFDGGITVGAENSPRSVTFSGDGQILDQIAGELREREVFVRRLKVPYAFHSRHMDPARDELVASLTGICTQPAAIPLFSTVSGSEMRAGDYDAEYWWHNVRHTVQFAPAINALVDGGHDLFLEISPHPVLSRSIHETCADRQHQVTVLHTLHREKPERATLLGSVGALHVKGVRVDWTDVFPQGCPTVRLPTYAWKHESFWSESREDHQARLLPSPHPLLMFDLRTADPSWQTRLDLRLLPYLRDHVVQGHTIFPAAAYIETALGAGRTLFEHLPLLIEELDFSKALILQPDGAGPLMQLQYSRKTSKFTITSNTGKTSAPWTQNASGYLRAPEYELQTSRLNLEKLRNRLTQQIDRETIYEGYAGVGLPFGECFRGIQTAWRRGSEVIGRVSAAKPVAATCNKHVAHPSVLDSCMQVLPIALPDADQVGKLYLPVRAGRIRVFGELPAEVWSYARLTHHGGQVLVGNVSICDDAGRILMEIEDLRGQDVARTGTAAASSLKDWLYWNRWQVKPLPQRKRSSSCEFFQTPRAIAGTVQRRTVHPEKDASAILNRYIECAEDVNRLCLHYITEAFAKLGWRPEQGSVVDPQSLARAMRIAPTCRQVFGRYLSFMEQSGLLRASNGKFRVVGKPPAEDGRKLWCKLLHRMPMYFAELTLLRRCGPELPNVLRNRKNALDLIFAGDGMEAAEHLYQDAPSVMESNDLAAKAIATAVGRVPRSRTVRILEIGAGTGGTTYHLLPRLDPGRTEYVFTDISALFLSRAEQKFFDHPFVEYKVLDIEKDLSSQGFTPHSFDIVVASNVLHATRDLEQTTQNVRKLLAPKGLLMLLELEQLLSSIELVFALTKQWWRFSDKYRPASASSPVLTRDEWQTVLTENGFTNVTSLSGTRSAHHPGSVLYLARADTVGRRKSSALPARRIDAQSGLWLLFEDESGVARQVAAGLEQAGARPVFVTAGTAFVRTAPDRFRIRPDAPEDMAQLMASLCAEPQPLQGILHFWNIDVAHRQEPDTAFVREAETRGCHTIMHLIQALASHDGQMPPPRLSLVTQNGKAVEDDETPDPLQAPLWGMGHVVISERHRVSCKLIDISHHPDPEEMAALLDEITTDDGEQEVALRGPDRYVARLSQTSIREHTPASRRAGHTFRVQNPCPGILDQISLARCRRRRPRAGEVEIEVEAASLNFRDVMKGLGIYPTENEQDLLLGDECSGRVAAVGKGVIHLSRGDEVIAMGPGCFASHVTLPAAAVMQKPARLTFGESAIIPTAFLTAHYALRHIGNICPGDKVLIHSATGGVGLAAIQIAQKAGAEIFATAGNPAKRDLLRGLGIRHVMDSRSLEFADRIMAVTKGRGVDLVLNSLSGPAIEKGLSVLAPYGRFLELGKTDIYQNASIGLRPLRNNISMHVIDLAEILVDKPELMSDILSGILQQLQAGELHALPHRVFSVTQIASAFRYMAKARHIGKIVICMRNANDVPAAAGDTADTRFKSNASYLVVGGTRGVGLAVAQWMAERGARNIILASRSGKLGDDAQQAVARLRESGVHVTIEQLDVVSEDQVAGLLKELASRTPPLRGIVHSALVMDDGVITQQNRERFLNVTAPKIQGAWNLHRYSTDLDLDFFVMFSSQSSLFGTPGQCSYVSANAFLDTLAQYRRGCGLPALTINWGSISGVGYLARHADLEKRLNREGVLSITADQLTGILGRLMQTKAAHIGVLHLDWGKLSGSTQMASPRFSDLVEKNAGEGHEAMNDRKGALLAAPPEKRLDILMEQLKVILAKVLRTSPAKLNCNRPLTDMGLDSLMGVELLASLDTHYGISLPPGRLTTVASLNSLALMLLEFVTGGEETPQAQKKEKPDRPFSSYLTADASIVPLRAEGRRPPLFCIHPGGGLASIYESLVNALPPDLPVYGVQSRVWHTGEEELESLDRMAESYAEQLLHRHPQGPLRLLGFCIGGHLCLNIVRHLESRGRDVSLVALADSWIEVAGSDKYMKSFMPAYLMDIYNAFSRELELLHVLDTDTLQQEITVLCGQLAVTSTEDRTRIMMEWLSGRTRTGAFDQAGRQFLEKYLSLFNRHVQLIVEHQPVSVRSPVVLWETNDNPAGDEPFDTSWKDFVEGEYEVHHVECHHYELMFPTHVDTMAARLDALLRKNEAETNA